MPDSNADLFKPAPRVVRPRARKYKRLPVTAVVFGGTLTETGEMGDQAELVRKLPYMESTLFVKQAAADWVGEMTPHFAEWYGDNWQWRAGTSERDIVRPDGEHVATRISTVVHYFGFKGGYYHKVIDPVVMYGHRLDTIWPGDESDPMLGLLMDQLMRLLQWGVTLRDFCDKNGLEVRPTIGGISAQFLTDRRFYPKRRRKVPMAINERSREALPGNHYVLTVQPSSRREFTALYLDQHRAHHYHAKVTALPDSDQLYAYGRFTDLAEVVFEQPWVGFYGLYCLDLEAPDQLRRSQWITQTTAAFVFSNELSHLTDMGYKVTGVRAAWGSGKRDVGLSRYAQWASKQLDHYGDRPWLKSLLLSTYGTLATRPKISESVFRLARSGEEITMLTGKHRLTGTRVRASKKLEPKIANVLHRGMIEAATRSESVGYAQFLANSGQRILSIYADAVIVEDNSDRPLSYQPEPWRLKTRLNHLQFINQQAFVSGEMTKLPGVGRDANKYRGPLARKG